MPSKAFRSERRAPPNTGYSNSGIALTRDFRETVQARVRRDAAFRKGLLRDAIESLQIGKACSTQHRIQQLRNRSNTGFQRNGTGASETRRCLSQGAASRCHRKPSDRKGVLHPTPDTATPESL